MKIKWEPSPNGLWFPKGLCEKKVAIHTQAACVLYGQLMVSASGIRFVLLMIRRLVKTAISSDTLKVTSQPFRD
jgi:hypothetical protein